ncbi:MAG: hypothetical protein EXR29_05870 [Betaproteobacteria bacterium]|nr:hypothetical protein [Betaproteobacteria bacterium]
MRILLPYNQHTLASSFYTDFHAGLKEAAHELGHETVRFVHTDVASATKTETESLYRLLGAKSCDVVLDLCSWAYGLSQVTVWDGSKSGQPIFDSLDIPYVAMLYDQPWFQPLEGVRSERLYASVPDRYNVAQLALVYPEIQLRGTPFVPPAARTANDRSRPWPERDIDVLFVGNVFPDALERLWRADPSAALFNATADHALAAPDRPLHEALLQAAREANVQLRGSAAVTILQPVEYFLRSRYRVDAVQEAAATGVAVHVVGKGWDMVDLPASVVQHAATDYEGMMTMAGRARICLDVSTYPGGANDRVFNYSLNRAVCMTNAGGYLSEVYGDSGGVQFYSLSSPKELALAIAALVAAPGRLRDQGEAGRAITLETQNWRVRLQAILDCVAANP